jgi:hypothetical protein
MSSLSKATVARDREENHEAVPTADRNARLAADRRDLKWHESERLSLRRAVTRLKKQWGISANAAGLKTLLEDGRGPSALRPRPWNRERGPQITASELDHWAEYQLYRSLPAPRKFENATETGIDSAARRVCSS